jgi:NAD(P)-dependent dehydrogenase (short-subunit alcohol dehydrogenase family)
MPTVLITGANRGLGLEFAKQYSDEDWRVFAICRDPDSAAELKALAEDNAAVQIRALDVADSAAVRDLAKQLRNETIDVLINNAGLFGPKPQAEDDPRQSFGQLDDEVCMTLFAVNALAPIKMAEAFYPQVMASEQKKIVTITTAISSISETEGDLYAYRMSKAAVNMGMANLARDLKEAGILIGLMNPGWVKTAMGGGDAPLLPSQSIASMRGVIAGLCPEQSGVFLDYDGSVLPW